MNMKPNFEIILYEDEFFGEELEVKFEGGILGYPNSLKEAEELIKLEAEERGLKREDYRIQYNC